MHSSFWTSLSILLLGSILAGCQASGDYSIRNFGAKGDGLTLDTPAVNAAIAAASDGGGGTVVVPAGDYLCYSIHLKSNVTIYLDHGATIIAAGSSQNGEYDLAEPNEFDHYQDYGHTHWHNSLFWGEGIHDVSIIGPGEIYGRGLSRGTGSPTQPDTRPAALRETGAIADSAGRNRATGAKSDEPEDNLPALYNYDDRAAPATGLPGGFTPGTTQSAGDTGYPSIRDSLADGIGNKTISMKWCHNVVLRDFSILQGGHFGLLLTAVDNLTIDNLKIDTNRDGMDIDCCQNVRVSNCSVNSPQDDGICLKSSFGLGVVRPCENVTITNCYVTGGYVVGAMLDGTFRKHLTDYAPGLGGAFPPPPPSTQPAGNAGPVPVPPRRPPSGPGRTGRIKFGTESNGGFINITISNCVFDDCQGLAIESVDGGPIEDVTIDNITMRNIVATPIFIRLGNRARGPFAPIAKVSRINISNIICENVASRYACIISGIPGGDIEDLHMSNIRITYPGDRVPVDATTRPAENEKNYPEPTMFKAVPGYGFYIRHVKNLEMDNIELSTVKDDLRPPFFLDSVDGAEFFHVKAEHAAGVPMFHLSNVTNFQVRQSVGIADTARDSATDEGI
jgi:polygalacturonase